MFYGGSGGRGGDVVLCASDDVIDLAEFSAKKEFRAQSGANGLDNNKTGRDASALILKLPTGTIVHSSDGIFLADLFPKETEFILCRGGAGGRGGLKRRKAQNGFSGEEREILLDLRLACDVAVVGFTNCGKSSLLERVSHKTPTKISPYPFTTLVPVLGRVIQDYKAFTILELPAIIRKNQNKPLLGENFLKHLFRARLILLLLDAESESLNDDFDWIMKVLDEKKDSYFNNQKMGVLINKVDGRKKPVFSRAPFLSLSCQSGFGVQEVVSYCFQELEV